MKRVPTVLVVLLLLATILATGPSAVAAGGSISGTVTDVDTGLPVWGARVKAYDYGTGSPAGGAWTNSSGTYTIPDLPDGDYGIKIEGKDTGFVWEYYDDVPDWVDATAVTIAASVNVTGIDAPLAMGGAVSGTVTDDTTHLPLEGILVRDRDASIPTFRSYGSAWTDASGEYTILGLPAGNHLIEFDDRTTAGYITEWWNDQPDYLSADPVAIVPAMAVPSVDAALTLGTTTSGHVSDKATTADLTGIAVRAFDMTPSLVASATTDAFGNYTIKELAAGTYRVEFHDWSGQGYVAQWWDAKADMTSADPISVFLGTPTTGIDALMLGGGTISGVVTDETTLNPIEGIWVSAFSGPTQSQGVYTDASGNYTIAGLAAGSYDVFFLNTPDFVYVNEFWNDQPDRDSADPVIVLASANTSNIDAALATGVSISGTVIDAATDNPIPQIQVNAHNAATDEYVGSALTESDGTYVIAGLPVGSYDIWFNASNDPNYLTEWFNDQPTQGTADPVTISLGGPAIDIDAALTPRGRISGTVEAPPSGALTGVCVTGADAATGIPFETSAAGGTGNYLLMSVPASTPVTVSFDDCGIGEWVDVWWDDAVAVASATEIVLSQGELRTGIDVIMRHFPDVYAGDWFFDQVETIFEAGITQGYNDGTYRPDNTVTRAEMAVFLIRALSLQPIAAPTGIFPDVPPGEWYAGYVEKLHAEGITQGYGDGTYRPDNTVTRAEMAAFIARAWNL